MPIFTVPDGDSLIESSQAELAKRYGIETFDYPSPDSTIKHMGFAPKTKEWYGWSHRAIAGFTVGSTVKAGDVIAQGTAAGLRGTRIFPVGYAAKTLDDAKAMAASFAQEVS